MHCGAQRGDFLRGVSPLNTVVTCTSYHLDRRNRRRETTGTSQYTGEWNAYRTNVCGQIFGVCCNNFHYVNPQPRRPQPSSIAGHVVQLLHIEGQWSNCWSSWHLGYKLQGLSGGGPWLGLRQKCQAWRPQLLPWAGSSNPWLFWAGRKSSCTVVLLGWVWTACHDLSAGERGWGWAYLKAKPALSVGY